MYGMVVAGVYTTFADMGELDNYAWYVNIDSHASVRSALPAVFQAYAARFPHIRLIIARQALTTTVPDGYFVAVSGNLV